MANKAARIDIDVITTFGGLMVGIAGVLVSEYYALNRTHLGCAIVIACMGYLVTRKLLPEKESVTCKATWQTEEYLFVLVTASFFILLLASILILKGSLYWRPPIYFGFVAGAVALLVAQTALFDLAASWKQQVVLGQILLLGVSFKAGAFFLYPSVSGNDPFLHQRFVHELVATGEFPKNTSYSPFPVAHLVAGVISLIPGINSKIGLFSISVLQSVALLAVFPIGRRLFGARTGLLAALLLSFTDYQIQWGVQIIPNTLGVVWFLLILMALVKRESASSPRDKLGWTIAILLFLCAMLLTHTLSTFVLLVTLLTILITTVLLKVSSYIDPNAMMVSGTLPILFGVAMLAYWMRSFSSPEQDFFTRLVLSVKSALSVAELGNADMVSVAGSIQAWIVFLGEVGWTLLLVPALMGALSLLNSKPRRAQHLILVQLMAVFSVIVYGSGVMGITQILPARWVPFLYVPACLLTASFLSRLLNAVKWRALTSSMVVLVLSTIIILMITSPGRSIPDSPLYANALSSRPGFYASELTAMRYAEYAYQGPLAASAKSRLVLHTASIIDPRQPDSYEPTSLIVMREFDAVKGFSIPFPRRQIIEVVWPTQAFLDYLYGPSRTRVYDNGTVQLFLSTSYTDTVQQAE